MSKTLFFLVCILFIHQVKSDCCSCSTMSGIASGIVTLGYPTSSTAQSQYSISLSPFSLGQYAQVFHAFAIAGFQGASNQQFYSLVVDYVFFSNGNTQLKFVMNYLYNNGAINFQTSWAQIKLSWLAVSTGFQTIVPSDPLGGSYIWAGTVGLYAPFSGTSGALMTNSPFVTQTSEMAGTPQCGFINSGPGYFDLSCSGQNNARFLTHSYIMGFQFNPQGAYTLAASALQGNGGTALSDVDQALDGTSFVTNFAGSQGSTTGPRLLISGFNGKLQYIKIAIVITTILDIITYPGGNTASFQYSGIYMSKLTLNQNSPISQSLLDSNGAIIPGDQNYNYFNLLSAKYSIFGLSSFQIEASTSGITTINCQLSFPDLNTILVEYSGAGPISNIRVSADRWSSQQISCSQTTTKILTFSKKQIITYPSLSQYGHIIYETSLLNYIFSASPKKTTSLSLDIYAILQFKLYRITPGMAYKIEFNLKNYNKYGIRGFSSENWFSLAILAEGVQVYYKQLSFSTLGPQDSDKTDIFTIKEGYIFKSTTPTIQIFLSGSRDLNNNLQMEFNIDLTQYNNVYDPIADCCVQKCPANQWLNVLTTPPTCVACAVGLIYNPSFAKCQCKPNHYPVTQTTASGVSLGITQCYPCSSSLILCSTCERNTPNICSKCQNGAQFVNSTVCSCSKGFYQNDNMCIGCPYRCQSCKSSQVCTSCPSITGRILDKGKCICPVGFEEINSYYCCKAKTFSIIINETCFPCSSLKGKNGTGFNDSYGCTCNKSFIFNYNNATCTCPNPNSYVDKSGICITCTGIGNSTGSASSSLKTCICNPTFIWDPAINSSACLCAKNSVIISNGSCFSCGTLKGKNSNGLADTTLRVCQCNKSFYFSQSSLNCVCNHPNSYIDKSGVCISCNGITNGTGKANQALKTCICNISFVWNPSINSTACLCPNNSIVLPNGTCFLCTSIKDKNSPGTVNNTSFNNKTLEACQCKKSFIFDKNAATCTCPDPNSYINKTSICIACSNIANGTGMVNLTSRACICNPTYIWNETVSVTACLCPANSIILANQSCFSCAALKGKNGTGLVNGTLNICQCNKSFVFNAQTNVCTCPDNNSFISNNLCVSCSGIGNGSGLANPKLKVCICIDTYIYNATLNKCICPAKYIETPVGCVSAKSLAIQCSKDLVLDSFGECVCKQANSILRNQNCILCTQKTVKGLQRISKNQCTCQDNMSWDKINLACICKSGYALNRTKCIQCSTVGNSTQKTNANKTSCICMPTFTWNPTAFECLCHSNSILTTQKTCLSCDAYIGSKGINEVNKASCLCLGNLKWNSLINMCDCGINQVFTSNGQCLSCSVSTDQNIVNPPLDAYNCKCSDPYFWDNLQNRCVLCDSAINALNKSPGHQLTCDCVAQYYFDIYTNKCRPLKGCSSSSNIQTCIDCTFIPHFNKQVKIISQSQQRRSKNTQFLSLEYNTFADVTKQYSQYGCSCQNGYFWQAIRKRCQNIFE